MEPNTNWLVKINAASIFIVRVATRRIRLSPNDVEITVIKLERQNSFYAARFLQFAGLVFNII